MKSEDVSPVNMLIKSDQKSAVENIQGANVFGITPDTFKVHREVLSPEIDSMERVPVVTRGVASLMKEDPEHAAAISPDANKLSWFEKLFSDYGRVQRERGEAAKQLPEALEAQAGTIGNAVVNRLGPERRLIELNRAKMMSRGTIGEDYTEEDDLELLSLRLERQNNFGRKDYGIEPGSLGAIPSDVISTGVDMAGMMARNAPLIATMTATSMAAQGLIGAAGGLVTGPGALATGAIGVGTGFATGLAAGVFTAQTIETYRDTAATLYGELDEAVGVDGKPLAIDENTKIGIAQGVGVVSSVLSAVTDKVMLESVPWMKKMITPSSVKEILLDPANTTLKQALLGIAKAVPTNATEEMLQEVTQIIGEEVGNTYNNGQASFENGLLVALDKIKNDPKVKARIGYAGTVGGIAGGAFAGGGEVVSKVVSAATSKKSKNTNDTDIVLPKGTPEEQVAEILRFQDLIDATNEIEKSTELSKLSKEQLTIYRNKLVSESGVQKHVYFDKEDLQKFANDQEKAERLRMAIDPTGVAAAAINAPSKMTMHEFLALRSDYPELSEFVKLHPEGPTPSQSRKFAQKIEQQKERLMKVQEKLNLGEKSPEERAYNAKITPDMEPEAMIDALGTKEVADAYLGVLDTAEVQAANDPLALAEIKTRRERVTALRDQLPDDKTSKEILTEALNTPQPINDVFGEEDFLNQATFTPPIEGVVSIQEVEAINSGYRRALQERADSIKEAALYEMNQVRDIVEEQANEVQRQIENDRILNDPNVAVVDRFLGSGKKPQRQIDPKTLNSTQQKRYANNEQLKKHKVFAKGGMTADAAAELLGVNGGENLLKILSRTPSREEIVASNTERNRIANRDRTEDAVDLNHTALANSFHNKTANHIAVMKVLKEKDWSAFKKGIKRIALQLPRIEDLTRQAKHAVSQMKVSDLNANIFKVGERKSHRIAMEAVLKADLEKAFINKQAAALNSELALQTHIAIGKINRVIKLAKKFNRPEIKQELKDAKSLDAANEILETFNLRPTSKKVADHRGAFQKWAKRQLELGIGNFDVPDHLSDVRESLEDMTVEQVLVVGERLQTLLHRAKRINAVNKAAADRLTLKTHDALVSKMDEQLKAHPDYDLARAENAEGFLRPMERFVRGFENLAAMLKNAEHILLDADRGIVGGLMVESIISPLKGDGKYAGQGEQGKAVDMIALSKRVDNIIEIFGKDEWLKMQDQAVDVEEWANNPKLKNGKLSKANLFMMMLNIGNESNIRRMAEGFGTDIDVIRSVLETHLDEKFAVAAQQIMDTFESYFPRVVEMHERVTGVRPEMIEANSFVHKGKVYPGGYFPLMGKSQMSVDAIRKRTDDVRKASIGEKLFKLKDQFYTDDMTRHNHTEQRTNSTEPISLSLNSIGMGFEMVVHDLNFREPIADVMKIITDDTISKSLAAAVGLADYNVVVNTVVEAAGSIQMENNALFDSTEGFDMWIAKARSGLSVGYLVGSVSSIAIQPASLTWAVERMGIHGQKHLASVAKTLATSPLQMSQAYDLAAEINPAIHNTREGLDENVRDPITGKMAKQHWNSGTKSLNNMREKVIEMGFAALGKVDQVQKIIITVAGYRQFLAGDAPGFDFDRVQKMTPEDRDHHAKVYATSLARLTLTTGSMIDRAPVQKKYRNAAVFFNDQRNIINNVMRMGRETRQSFKTGDYGKTAYHATTMMLTMAMAKLTFDLLRGNPTPITDEEKTDGADELAMKWANYLKSTVVDMTVGNIPFARDIKFAYDTDWQHREGFKSKGVTSVATSVGSDILNTVYLASDFIDIVMGEEAYLNPAEMKSGAMVLSYLTGGIPVKPIFQVYKALREYEENASTYTYVPSVATEFPAKLKDFKEQQATLPPAQQIPEEALKALDDIEVQLGEPEDQTSTLVPDRAIATIMQIESGGRWDAQNPNGSAAGLYQFTEGTWRDVMERAPELGLTENGRVSADTSQQELAMEWFTNDNARILNDNDIETTTENLYAAHFLGASTAVEVLTAPADQKLKTLISKRAMKDNGFAAAMKVRQFKTWIEDKVSGATVMVASVDN